MTQIDLSGDIQIAVDGSGPSGHAPVLGYVNDRGEASLSYRGSLIVQPSDKIAFWSRQSSGSLVASLASRPVVSLLYYSRDTPGAAFLHIRGRARVAPDQDNAVYAAMSQGERDRDPERAGVAIVIEVDSVDGEAGDGSRISQRR